MYGYVTPYIPELKIKDHELYKAYYCGLCKRIGQLYGQIGRFSLNYDCTFLAALLSGLTAEDVDFQEFRCAVHLTKRRGYIAAEPALDYAAAVTVILAEAKLRDNIADGDKRIMCSAASGLMGGAYAKACKAYPKTAKTVDELLGRLRELETAHCGSIDRTADVFGRLLAQVMISFPEIGNTAVLENFGYNLGRWIYIIDAADDIDEDRKRGRYNPLNFAENDSSSPAELAAYVYPGVMLTLANVGKAFELLKFNHSRELVENIVYKGLAHTTEKILGRNGERFGKSV